MIRGFWNEGSEVCEASRVMHVYNSRPTCLHRSGNFLATPRDEVTMAYQYPQYPQTYGPQRSPQSPYYSPQMAQLPSMPHGTPYQHTVDAYGRPLVQQSISPIGGPAQQPLDRSGQLYPINRGPSNQYGQSPSSEPESPMYMSRNMARGYSSQSTGTDGSLTSPQRQRQGPKE